MLKFLSKRLFPTFMILLTFILYIIITHEFPMLIPIIGSQLNKYFLYLIAGLCLIIILSLYINKSMNILNILALLYFITLSGILFGIVCIGQISSINYVIDDPKYFEDALRKYEASSLEYVEGFPKHIPQSAKDVKFNYSSNGLLALKFRTNEEQIQHYMTLFSQKAMVSGSIDMFNQTEYESIARQAGYFYIEVPNTYLVYILNAKRRPSDTWWNHGACCIIGILPETYEITFYSEKW